MKTNKLIPLLTFAIVVVLGATGCHHKQYVTRLPEGAPAGGQVSEALPPSMPLGGGDQSVGVTPGGTATTGLDQFEGMNENRGPLAQYTVHFDFDSSVVKKSEDASVQAVADYLKSDATDKLLIEGHCDERGTEEYNRSLGERRALSLREALGKDGVDPDRIRTISYGSDRPVDPGHDESAWKKNRRGEFVLLTPK
jgi:peptidoglycan-associated lipoprotein